MTASAVSRDRPSVQWILVASCALALAWVATAHATDVTTCGTTVASGDTGVLQADLSCPNDFFGVRLLKGSTLQLNGHSIVGGLGTFATVLGVAGVNDEAPDEGGPGRFTIVGPGEIAGPGPDVNNFVSTSACVTLQNGRATITSPTGVIDIHGCNFGIVGYILQYNDNKARATIDHVIVHDNSQSGIELRKFTASQVTAYGNHDAGIHAISTAVVTDCNSHDNPFGQGVFAGRTLKGSNVTVTNNVIGAESFRTVVLTNLTSTGNQYWGVQARNAKVTDSTVTGNGVADFVTGVAPRLVNTTCGTSLSSTPPQTTWGVCAND
jgi:hypothetical protein